MSFVEKQSYRHVFPIFWVDLVEVRHPTVLLMRPIFSPINNNDDQYTPQMPTFSRSKPKFEALASWSILERRTKSKTVTLNKQEVLFSENSSKEAFFLSRGGRRTVASLIDDATNKWVTKVGWRNTAAKNVTGWAEVQILKALHALRSGYRILIAQVIERKTSNT